jgi:hypothetical protein
MKATDGCFHPGKPSESLTSLSVTCWRKFSAFKELIGFGQIHWITFLFLSTDLGTSLHPQIPFIAGTRLMFD